MPSAVAGVPERVVQTTARLARQCGLAPDPGEQCAALIGLVVVAGGAASAKSALIAGERWSVAPSPAAGLGHRRDRPDGGRGVDPGDGRTVAVRRASASCPSAASPTSRPPFIVGPLLLSGVVTAVGLLVRSEPGHLDGGEMVELVLLVAGAEELIYRGAVLALAHRALPAVAAELSPPAPSPRRIWQRRRVGPGGRTGGGRAGLLLAPPPQRLVGRADRRPHRHQPPRAGLRVGA